MFDGSKIAEYAGMLTLGIFGAVLGIQKLLKNWKETSAESSVISLMHTELERMSNHNRVLATELASLQIEIMNLNKELRMLTAENQKLHQEVVSLTSEVTRLQELLKQKKD